MMNQLLIVQLSVKKCTKFATLLRTAATVKRRFFKLEPNEFTLNIHIINYGTPQKDLFFLYKLISSQKQ